MTAIKRDSTKGTPLVDVERVAINGCDVAILTLNRPEQRNPLDRVTLRSLLDIITGLESSDAPPQALVITGAGPAFSSGGDLKGYQSLYSDPLAFRQFMDDFYAVCERLERSGMVTAAMVNGTCVAGGLELALACDFVTIADDARIGDGHLRFAQLPGAGGSQRLVRAIGAQRAKVWLLTGALFPADEAVALGLCVFAAPVERLRSDTLELLSRVCASTPLGLRRMKQLIALAQRTTLDDGLAQESGLVHEYATASHDAREGITAFAERRDPLYTGS